MKIHEYQAKEIFRRFGVPTPRGEMVTTPDQARAAAERLGTKIVVVKAQIHAGGRGKAGGVKLAKSPAEAADLAKAMLGMKLVTPQTGPAGRIVQRLLIEEWLDIKRELYLSILVDRAVAAPVIMASTAGGMEIEEVAHTNPELILRETIFPATGLQPYHARKLAFGLGLSGDAANAAGPFLQGLYRTFLETDASLAEINPLIVTGDGKLVALDAKMTWRAGCIIRSAFLGKIKAAFANQPDLSNLLLDEYFKGVIERCQASWRRVVAKAVEAGVPVPAFMTALAFFDGYRSARLPANLLQAQRDYFGAHTYERIDKPGKFHTEWMK